eukprot:388953-Hanusia_phi.AAC.3
MALKESETSEAAGAAGAGNELLNMAKISLPGELNTLPTQQHSITMFFTWARAYLRQPVLWRWLAGPFPSRHCWRTMRVRADTTVGGDSHHPHDLCSCILVGRNSERSFERPSDR